MGLTGFKTGAPTVVEATIAYLAVRDCRRLQYYNRECITMAFCRQIIVRGY